MRNISFGVVSLLALFTALTVGQPAFEVQAAAKSSPSTVLFIPIGSERIVNLNPNNTEEGTKANGWITGRVADAVSDAPLAKVQIEVQARIVDKLSGGTLSLRSMEETIPLGIVSYTNSMGKFKVKVSLDEDTKYFKVIVHAEGYEELQNVMVRVEPLKRCVVNFQLIKVELTPQEVEILDQKHELQKMNLLEKNPSFIQTTDTTNKSENEKTPPYPTNTKESFFYQQAYPIPDQVYVINLYGFTGYINLDDFISGVVSAELGGSFPFETLKAQAVASRSYALERYNRTGVANGGQAYTSTINNTCRTATMNTIKIVILYGGNAISAYFSARCNGDSTLDSEDGVWNNPSTCSVGGNYVAYARSRPCSGHGNCSMTTETPCCNVTTGDRNVYTYGHGVGMCQRGSEQFACRDGKDWQQILTGYYTDITIANLPALDVGSRIMTTTNVNARSTPCSSNLIEVPSGTYGTIIAGPNISFCSNLGTCNGSSGTYWTWWQVDYDNGVVGRWSVENYLKRTSGGGVVQITVTTNPIVQNIIVDGTTYTPPQTLSWSADSQHTIGTPSPQYAFDQKTRCNFSSWSDGGAQTHTIIVPNSNTAYTASFSTQYLLDTAVNPDGSGSIVPSPSGPWYDPDQAVQLTATANNEYTFSNWSGDLNSSSNPANLTMNGPKSVTANFSITETISTPSTPSGPTSGTVGEGYLYSTGDATSDLGHSVEYRFNWGDGTYSDWSSPKTATNSWSSPGIYLVKAQARCATHTGKVSSESSGFSVTIAQITVASFQINNGAAETSSRKVTLNNTVTGSPTHYMASESSTFKRARWKTYTGAPKFRLSSRKETKTVYFKIRNAKGKSSVVSDSIILK